MRRGRPRVWHRSEIKALGEEYNKWLASKPEGQPVKLRQLARHIHDTVFPKRTLFAIEAVLQRSRIWQPTSSKGTTSENAQPRPPRTYLMREGVVKAHKCSNCGHLTEVE
jgi:hypothetical protein